MLRACNISIKIYLERTNSGAFYYLNELLKKRLKWVDAKKKLAFRRLVKSMVSSSNIKDLI